MNYGAYFIYLIAFIVLFSSFFIVKQQTSVIVERFGRFLSIRNSGLQMKIPLVDRIAGKVSLKIGGVNGKIFDLNIGDVLIIPAGVGHHSVSAHTNYQFVGGYPNGNDWDLKTGLEEHERTTILKAISNLAIPDKDPIFGQEGLLFEKWKI